jgi:hypothetical protein
LIVAHNQSYENGDREGQGRGDHPYLAAHFVKDIPGGITGVYRREYCRGQDIVG